MCIRPTNRKPKQIDDSRCDVWDDCHNKDELPKLLSSPSTLEVFPTIENGRTSDEQGKNVLFSEGGSEVHPWIEQ